MSKAITIEDLQGFLEFIECHKAIYSESNVAQIENILGTFLKYLKYRDEVES